MLIRKKEKSDFHGLLRMQLPCKRKSYEYGPNSQSIRSRKEVRGGATKNSNLCTRLFEGKTNELKDVNRPAWG